MNISCDISQDIQESRECAARPQSGRATHERRKIKSNADLRHLIWGGAVAKRKFAAAPFFSLRNTQTAQKMPQTAKTEHTKQDPAKI